MAPDLIEATLLTTPPNLPFRRPKDVWRLARLGWSLWKPGGRLLSRRPVAVRLAAIEGLKLAGTNQSVTALGELRKDSDKSVATAARSAFESASGL